MTAFELWQANYELMMGRAIAKGCAPGPSFEEHVNALSQHDALQEFAAALDERIEQVLRDERLVQGLTRG